MTKSELVLALLAFAAAHPRTDATTPAEYRATRRKLSRDLADAQYLLLRVACDETIGAAVIVEAALARGIDIRGGAVAYGADPVYRRTAVCLACALALALAPSRTAASVPIALRRRWFGAV